MRLADLPKRVSAELEIAISGHAYVATRSGWFSDRSAGYLAAGRPVVLQDTGFSEWLPTGEGLHAFDDVDTAEAAIRRVMDGPHEQPARARQLAAEDLEASVVLPRLVDLGFDT